MSYVTLRDLAEGLTASGSPTGGLIEPSWLDRQKARIGAAAVEGVASQAYGSDVRLSPNARQSLNAGAGGGVIDSIARGAGSGVGVVGKTTLQNSCLTDPIKCVPWWAWAAGGTIVLGAGLFYFGGFIKAAGHLAERATKN